MQFQQFFLRIDVIHRFAINQFQLIRISNINKCAHFHLSDERDHMHFYIKIQRHINI